MAKGRRRRRNRRHLWRSMVLALGVAVAAALVVGVASDIGRESGPYRRSVDRSYAALVSPVISQSNQAGFLMAAVLQNGPEQDRTKLAQELDAIVVSTEDSEDQADTSVPPDPVGDLADQLHTVFAERAQAAASVRSAIDALLELSPLPEIGGPDAGSNPAPAPASAVLDMTPCEGELVSAGLELEQADQTFAAFRRHLARSPGSASVPASRWLTHLAAWQPVGIDAFVGALAGMDQLQPRHELVVSTYVLSPPPLPQVPPTTTSSEATSTTTPAVAAPPTNAVVSGLQVLPPTSSIAVEATIANEGNVDESAVVVTATLTEPGTALDVSRVITIPDLASGGARVADFDSMPVARGKTYVLDVAITPPPVPGDTSRLSTAPLGFRVALGAPASSG